MAAWLRPDHGLQHGCLREIFEGVMAWASGEPSIRSESDRAKRRSTKMLRSALSSGKRSSFCWDPGVEPEAGSRVRDPLE